MAVAVRRRPTGITIYIDGAAVPVTRANNAAYVAMENLTAPLQIGRESNGWKQFNGGLDELRLWNVARTSSGSRRRMTTELTGSEPGLVGYWRFNEGAGTVAPGSASGALADDPVQRSAVDGRRAHGLGAAGCDAARHQQHVGSNLTASSVDDFVPDGRVDDRAGWPTRRASRARARRC